MSTPVAVIGSGSFGTCLALLAAREHDVQLPGVTGEIEAATSFAAAYLDPGVESRVERNSRLFELRLVIDPPHPGGSMRVAVASDRELVRALWAEFQAEATPGRPGAQSSVDFQLDAGKVWLWIDETGEPTCIAARNREYAQLGHTKISTTADYYATWVGDDCVDPIRRAPGEVPANLIRRLTQSDGGEPTEKSAPV